MYVSFYVCICRCMTIFIPLFPKKVLWLMVPVFLGRSLKNHAPFVFLFPSLSLYFINMIYCCDVAHQKTILYSAVMASAIGPSGPNSVYLNQLDNFLLHASSSSSSTVCVAAPSDDDTSTLASMVRAIQGETTKRENQLYFLTGCGSNQHNQLLLRQPTRTTTTTTTTSKAITTAQVEENVDSLETGHGEEEDGDSHEMTEIVVCGAVRAKRDDDNSNNSYSDDGDPPQQLFAGGGHSGLLTRSGRLLLWGWNDDGQLGRGGGVATTATTPMSTDTVLPEKDPFFPLPILQPLPNILVETAAFGFSHTLVVERGTGRLYGFGNNDRGQVVEGATPTTTTTALSSSSTSAPAVPASRPPSVVTIPTLVTAPGAFLHENEAVKAVGAGVFHSACITQVTGELLTFGCGRYGQCLKKNDNDDDGGTRRWKPSDGSELIQVACGRRHTVCLDDKGRIWTFGENKHGQLGRDIPNHQDHHHHHNDGISDKDSDSTTTIPTKKRNPLVDATPRQVQIVDHDRMTKQPCHISVHCGWSHTIVTIHYKNEKDDDDHANDEEEVIVYGWGRNDKGQLGLGSSVGSCPTSTTTTTTMTDTLAAAVGTNPSTLLVVPRPSRLFQDKKIALVDCGSEFTYVLDQSGVIWGCGWNEHGNLGIGGGGEKDEGVVDETVVELTRTLGAKIVAPPPSSPLSVEEASSSSSPMVDNDGMTPGGGGNSNISGSILLAAGGAHFLAMRSTV
jgi:alpha-tubulin suppressor-like RCC1 family protein